MKIPVIVEVSAEKVRDQICVAFEGGSNYWLQEADLVQADIKPTEKPWYSCPKLFEGKYQIALKYDDPKKDEGNGEGRKTINQDDVQKGMFAMANKSPRHFADLLNEEGDTITADVFFQYILFGEVIYG